mgnify:CR=1 FL=1
MKIETSEFLEDLKEKKKNILDKVKTIASMDDTKLKWRNILECIEHLNLYGDFYIPEIKKAIQKNKKGNEQYFKPGFIGNYFSNSMLPGKKMSKMKTFKDKNPIGNDLNGDVFKRFFDQQEQFQKFYHQAENISLNRTKTSISISSLIKLKLGDTFAFLLNHELRHLRQMENILEALEKTKGAKNDTLLQA